MSEPNVQRDIMKAYRDLLNQSVDWVWRSTPEGVFTYLSPSLKAMTGFEPGELLGRSFESYAHLLLTDKSIEIITESLKKRKAGGFGNGTRRFELVYKRKDGSEFVGEMCSAPMLNSRGERIAIQGTTRDITAQRLLVDELRNSIELFSIFFHSNDNPCCMTDPITGVIIYANSAWLDRFGCSLDKITGIVLASLGIFEEAGKAALVDIIGKVKANNNAIRGKIYLTTRVGEVQACNVTSFSVEISGVERVFTAIIDNTDNERIENELLKVAKLESINALAGDVAHELRNLLTGVVGNLSLARKADSKNESDEYLGKTEEAAAHLGELMGKLVAFAEIEGSKFELTDMGKLLSNSVPIPLRGSQVTHGISVAKDLWQVHINQKQIIQVINNLVINAQQAMPGGGNIKVIAENSHCESDTCLNLNTGRYIKVSIADHGSGFTEQIAGSIFDTFFTTKKNVSGLGLTSSKSIIEKHKGCIEASSTPGVGTTISFYLPVGSDRVSLEIVPQS